jgi:hypothetical protein
MDKDEVSQLLKEGSDPIDVIMEKHPDEVSVVLMDVTKELASKWLDKRCSRQRKTRRSNINKIVVKVNNGDWFVINNGLGFDTEGQSIDGKHRLHVVLECELEFLPILVVCNLEPDALTKAIDNIISPRNLKDQVKLAEGRDVDQVELTIANSVFTYGLAIIDNFSALDLENYLHKYNVMNHRDGFDWIMKIYSSIEKIASDKRFPFLYSNAVRAYLWAKNNIKDEKERQEYITKIEHFVFIAIDAVSDWMKQGKGMLPGVDEDGEQWAWKTREFIRLCKVRASMGAGKRERTEICRKINRALHQYLSRKPYAPGRAGSRILKSRTEYFPLPEEMKGLKQRVAKRLQIEEHNIYRKEKKYSS